MSDPDVLSSQETARILGVTPRTVQSWAEAGVLRAWKTPGGHRRFQRDEVERLAEHLKRNTEMITTPRVLVVEDDPDILELYGIHFDSWGIPMDYKLAKDGYEGLIELGRMQPHLLILDLQMAGLNGFHLLDLLRDSSHFANMRIVVVTALGMNELMNRETSFAGVRVYTKPVPFDKLRELVAEIAQPHAPQDA